MNNNQWDLLPVTIFYDLQLYLSHWNYRALLHTSKRIFQDVKYQTQYLNLNSIASKQFYEDIEFQQNILQRIQSPWRQLSINLLEYGGEKVIRSKYLQCVHRLLVSNHHLLLKNWEEELQSSSNSPSSPSTSLRNRTSSSCSPLIEITHLSIDSVDCKWKGVPLIPKLQTISLRGLAQLTSLQSLQTLKEVRLEGCHSIKDVSPLKNCEKLKLIDCVNVSDVSCLGKVRDLSFIHCSGITNLTGLGKGNQKLVLSRCMNIGFGLEIFQLIPHVVINGWHQGLLEFQSFMKCEKLELARCRFRSLQSFPICPQLLSISIAGNNIIDNFQILINLQILKLNGDNIIQELPYLPNLQHLELINCTSFRSLKKLSTNCQSVILGDCRRLKDFSPLKFVTRVKIIDCPFFQNCTDLENVQELTLGGSACYVVSLEGLGRSLKTFSLKECKGLQSLEGIEFIPHIIIDGMSEIKALFNLKSSNCRNVRIDMTIKDYMVWKRRGLLKPFMCQYKIDLNSDSPLQWVTLFKI